MLLTHASGSEGDVCLSHNMTLAEAGVLAPYP